MRVRDSLGETTLSQLGVHSADKKDQRQTYILSAGSNLKKNLEKKIDGRNRDRKNEEKITDIDIDLLVITVM